MQAVELNRHSKILFSDETIPDDLRQAIVDRLDGAFLGDVTLTLPPESLANGHSQPAFLSVSRSDPSHFEIINDRDEAVSRGLELAGKSYHVVRNWRHYVETLMALEAIAAEATGVEPPDSPDAPDLIEGH